MTTNQTEAVEIAQLCTSVGVSHRVAAYIMDAKTVEQVRAELRADGFLPAESDAAAAPLSRAKADIAAGWDRAFAAARAAHANGVRDGHG
jgi:hypothetical protein